MENKIITKDNHDISFIEKETASNENILIMAHGITVNKSESGLFDEFEGIFNDHNWNTIRFDFRGHGDSHLKNIDCTIIGMIEDLYCIVKYSQEKYKNIYILATSFGASITLLFLKMFKKAPIKGLMLICPVIDYKTTFTETKLPWGKSFFPQNGIESAISSSPILIGSRKFQASSKMVSELYYLDPSNVEIKNIPISLHHGINDDMVSYDSCLDYYNKFKNNCNMEMHTYNASHGIKEERPKLIENIKKYFFSK